MPDEIEKTAEQLAKNREYQNRQRYRRIPLDEVRWKTLGRQAAARQLTRTALGAMYLRFVIDSGGEGVTLTARPKDWTHSQRKPHDSADDCRTRSDQDRLEEILEATRQAKWIANGANMLHGPNVIRKTLKIR